MRRVEKAKAKAKGMGKSSFPGFSSHPTHFPGLYETGKGDGAVACGENWP